MIPDTSTLVWIAYLAPIIPVWRRLAWKLAQSIHNSHERSNPSQHRDYKDDSKDLKPVEDWAQWGLLWGFFLALVWPIVFPTVMPKTFLKKPKEYRQLELSREIKDLERKLLKAGIK